MKPTDLSQVLDQLSDKSSPKRRSAAKKLRKLKDHSAGPALLTALELEVEDPRTWETQYQMIMALGECCYKQALPFLEQLSRQDFEAKMVYVAIGDSIVRLARPEPNDVSVVFDLLKTKNNMLINGALRAIAMLRLVPSTKQIDRLISFAEKNHACSFWIVAAAPGWTGSKVERFLAECAESDQAELSNAAKLAQTGKYKAWNPL